MSLNEVRALFGVEIESAPAPSTGKDEANRNKQIRIAELEEELEFPEASLALGYKRMAQARSDAVENLEEIETLIRNTQTRYEELDPELQALKQ
ncbi:MAG: hypothetical protein HKN14_01300 [Marinicaulis sp.]|nr:hypothetical protein [Marinicaulis sp.]